MFRFGKKSITTLLTFILVISMFSSVSAAEVPKGKIVEGKMNHDGLDRTYKYYVPSTYKGNKPVPLMLSFHGSGSSAAGQIELTGYEEVAEKEGFIVVFPDSTVTNADDEIIPTPEDGPFNPNAGLERKWNIGSEPGALATVDDVGFTSSLIDHFSEEYNIDESRVYATGMSYGGFFVNHLAVLLTDRIAGIGAVTGQMGINTSKSKANGQVTAVYVMGDSDPTVPPGGIPNFTLSVENGLSYWIMNNQIKAKSKVTYLPGIVDDGTKIRREEYRGGKQGTRVVSYTVENGGHTWPGGPQYLPANLIGIASQQMNASEVIWNDLKRHKIPGAKSRNR
jgi:polyhydroxybutyrate depolymerase